MNLFVWTVSNKLFDALLRAANKQPGSKCISCQKLNYSKLFLSDKKQEKVFKGTQTHHINDV